MKYNIFFILTGLFITLLYSGCDRSKQPATSPSFISGDLFIISLDKKSLSLDDSLVVTLNNNTKEDVILHSCAFEPGYDIEQKIDGSYVKLYDKACAAIGSPFYIQAGIEMSFTLHLMMPDVQLPGFFRLNFWLYKNQDGERVELPLNQKISPAFQITE